jgi:hypothetical protein
MTRDQAVARAWEARAERGTGSLRTHEGEKGEHASGLVPSRRQIELSKMLDTTGGAGDPIL